MRMYEKEGDSFLRRFVQRGGSISSKYYSVPWCYYTTLAKLTETVDYKCNFGSNGCRGGKARNPIRGCCSSCYSNLGFLNGLPNSYKIIESIEILFKKEVGFWRPEIGCILPREYRSTACLATCCAKEEMSRRDLIIINMFSDVKYYYKRFKSDLAEDYYSYVLEGQQLSNLTAEILKYVSHIIGETSYA